MLLAVKLKNALPQHYTFKLKNVSVNGDKRGCTGFIQYGDKTVYVDTERSCGLAYMARAAANDRDFLGGRNHWADDLESLVGLVNQLLNNAKESA